MKKMMFFLVLALASSKIFAASGVQLNKQNTFRSYIFIHADNNNLTSCNLENLKQIGGDPVLGSIPEQRPLCSASTEMTARIDLVVKTCFQKQSAELKLALQDPRLKDFVAAFKGDLFNVWDNSSYNNILQPRGFFFVEFSIQDYRATAVQVPLYYSPYFRSAKNTLSLNINIRSTTTDCLYQAGSNGPNYLTAEVIVQGLLARQKQAQICAGVSGECRP